MPVPLPAMFVPLPAMLAPLPAMLDPVPAILDPLPAVPRSGGPSTGSEHAMAPNNSAATESGAVRTAKELKR
jgi:hypothetical protein